MNLLQHSLAKATVKIAVRGNFKGTGFFITPDGYILTAFHVIGQHPPEITVKTFAGEFLIAHLDVGKSLPSQDLAVLKVVAHSVNCVPLGVISSQQVTDKVLGVGYPLGDRADNPHLGFYDGTISRLREDGKIETDAVRGQGQSGGLLYHPTSQRVIGVAVEGYKPERMIAGLAQRLDGLLAQWTGLSEITARVAQRWKLENPKPQLKSRLTSFAKVLKRPEVIIISTIMILFGLFELADRLPLDFPTKEIVELEKRAQRGDISAQIALGEAYYRGEKVDKNYQEAKKWFEQAAAQGDPKALTSLAILYVKGRGVAQNYQAARELFEKAAQQDYPAAWANLFKMYAEGLGVPRDEDRSKQLFTKLQNKLQNGDFINDIPMQRMFAFDNYRELMAKVAQQKLPIVPEVVPMPPVLPQQDTSPVVQPPETPQEIQQKDIPPVIQPSETLPRIEQDTPPAPSSEILSSQATTDSSSAVVTGKSFRDELKDSDFSTAIVKNFASQLENLGIPKEKIEDLRKDDISSCDIVKDLSKDDLKKAGLTTGQTVKVAQLCSPPAPQTPVSCSAELEKKSELDLLNCLAVDPKNTAVLQMLQTKPLVQKAAAKTARWAAVNEDKKLNAEVTHKYLTFLNKETATPQKNYQNKRTVTLEVALGTDSGEWAHPLFEGKFIVDGLDEFEVDWSGVPLEVMNALLWARLSGHKLFPKNVDGAIDLEISQKATAKEITDSVVKVIVRDYKAALEEKDAVAMSVDVKKKR